MLFNSIDFAIFLPLVFILYWFCTQRSLRMQNLLLVVASYVFYGWWDWRFLSLILFSTFVDYAVGMGLLYNDGRRTRKALLFTSIVVNLGLLAAFKYYNFFAANFVEAFRFFGRGINLGLLHVVLPVGISFYTFQTMSYSIDVYQRKLEPTRDFIAFAAFVSFFPQLVAGPIERATHLLPQFYRKREFDSRLAADGLRQMLWGLVKKIVIADSCAKYVNQVFDPAANYSGGTMLLGAVLFAFQIYGDFSGYSDVAIGTSRLFGFNLCRNFAFPYFSRDIAEFWRRWHISLSTWFRDYLYIPLGGSRGGKLFSVRNILVVFIVSGFWHGANWTFIAWGALNAIYFMPLLLLDRNRSNTDTVAAGKRLPSLREFGAMSATFALTVLAWIFFRSGTLHQAFGTVGKIFSPSLFAISDGMLPSKGLLVFIPAFMLIEWLGREHQYAIERIDVKLSRPGRWAFYYACLLAIFLYGGPEQQFIYFQF